MVRVVLGILALHLTFSLTFSPATEGAAAGPTFRGDAQAVAEVRAAYQKFHAARTWRARMRGPGGTATMEYMAPDRFRTVTTQAGTTMEMFTIGRQTWMHTGGQCQPLPGAPPNVFNPQQGMADRGQGTVTVARGAPETVDGHQTKTYLLTIDDGGTQVRQKLYVLTGSGLPRRVEMESRQGPLVIDYLDVNAPITIKNPPC